LRPLFEKGKSSTIIQEVSKTKNIGGVALKLRMRKNGKMLSTSSLTPRKERGKEDKDSSEKKREEGHDLR